MYPLIFLYLTKQILPEDSAGFNFLNVDIKVCRKFEFYANPCFCLFRQNNSFAQFSQNKNQQHSVLSNNITQRCGLIKVNPCHKAIVWYSPVMGRKV